MSIVLSVLTLKRFYNLQLLTKITICGKLQTINLILLYKSGFSHHAQNLPLTKYHCQQSIAFDNFEAIERAFKTVGTCFGILLCLSRLLSGSTTCLLILSQCILNEILDLVYIYLLTSFSLAHYVSVARIGIQGLREDNAHFSFQ